MRSREHTRPWGANFELRANRDDRKMEDMTSDDFWRVELWFWTRECDLRLYDLQYLALQTRELSGIFDSSSDSLKICEALLLPPL